MKEEKLKRKPIPFRTSPSLTFALCNGGFTRNEEV